MSDFRCKNKLLCYVMLCYVMLCYVMLCYVMLCYGMLWYFMLCYVYVMLCYERIDEGNPVDVIYLDFGKAFDKVPHTRLVKSIKHGEFEGKNLLGIKAGYLVEGKRWALVTNILAVGCSAKCGATRISA